MEAAGADPGQALRARLKQAAEICAHFKRVLRGYRMYQSDHEILQGHRTELYAALTSYLEGEEALILDITAKAFSLDGRTLVEAETPDDAITLPLFLDGVHRMAFRRGVTQREVDRLMHLWNGAFVRDEDAEQTFMTRFWEADFELINVVAVETFSDTTGEDEDIEEASKRQEANVKAVMGALSGERLAGGSTGQDAEMGLMRVTREDLALLKMDAVAELTAEDLERADTSKRPPVSGLQPEERAELVREALGEPQGALPRALRAVLDVYDFAGEEDMPRITEMASTLFSSLASAGKFQLLAQMVGQAVAFARSDPVRIEVRCLALDRLVRGIEADAVLDPVVAGLDDPEAAESAMGVLSMLQPRNAPALLGRLELLSTSEGKKKLREMLARMRVSGESLAETLKTTRGPLVFDILELGNALGDEHSAPLWDTALTNPDPEVRKWILANVSAEALAARWATLRRLVVDPDLTVRRGALDHLMRAGDRGVIAPIAQLLARSSVAPEERRHLYAALARIQGPDASKVLQMEFERLEDVDLRCACALALGRAGDPSARAVLEGAGRGLFGSKKLRAACEEAMKRLGSQGSG